MPTLIVYNGCEDTHTAVVGSRKGNVQILQRSETCKLGTIANRETKISLSFPGNHQLLQSLEKEKHLYY